MIKYRPNLVNLKHSLREERSFDSVEDLTMYVFDRWRRVVSFMGAAEPFRPDEILISDIQGDDPQIGYKNVRRVSVTRMADTVYSSPMCIGYIGE